MSTQSPQVSRTSGKTKRRRPNANEDGGHNESEDIAAQSKRQRVSRACDSCRSKKDKCDGILPVCSTCASLNRPCTWRANPKKRGLPTGYIRSLELLWGLAFQKIRGSEDSMRALLRTTNLPSHLATMGKEAEGSDTLLSAFKNSTMLKDLERLLITLEQPEEERERNLQLFSDGGTPLDVDGPSASSESQEWQIPDGLEHHETLLPTAPRPAGVDPSRASITNSAPRPSAYRTKDCGVQTSTNHEFRPDPTAVNLTANNHRMTSTSAPLQLPCNAWAFFDIYFSYTQCWFPILEKHDILRTAFQYTEGDVNMSPAVSGSGDHAALWAVLAFATLQNGFNDEATDSGAQSHQISTSLQRYNLARGLIPTEHGPYEVGHVQALLIMSLLNLGQQEWTAAWMLVGQAIRIAQSLGLGQASLPSSTTTPEQSKQLSRAKHVFLGCFVLETLIAEQMLQCPSLRRDDLSRVGCINEDGLEEWHPWEGQADLRSMQTPRTSMQRGPMQALSTFNRFVSLVAILNDFCCLRQDSTVSRSQLELLELQLQHWLSALPKSYRIDSQSDPPKLGSPHIFVLEMTYWSIASALSQHIASRESGEGGRNPETAHRTRALESSKRSLQLLQTYFETYSFSATAPIFGMLLGYCVPRAALRGSTTDQELVLQGQISSYSSQLARIWMMPDPPIAGIDADQRNQRAMAAAEGSELHGTRPNNDITGLHVPTRTRPPIAQESHAVPNTLRHPSAVDSFLSSPWLRVTQTLDNEASPLPAPNRSLTASGGTSAASAHPASMDTSLNDILRQPTSAALNAPVDSSVIPSFAPFHSDRQYASTYQEPSFGLGALDDMHGYGQPREQQRIAPDLDALFDELASLDGAEKADNLPEFMQNLGFVSDSTVPEAYLFSSQIEPFLLAQTQQFPSAGSPPLVRREPQPLMSAAPNR